jgi:hypothetical protein
LRNRTKAFARNAPNAQPQSPSRAPLRCRLREDFAVKVEGTLLVYRPGQRQPDVSDFALEPSLEEVASAIGGRPQTVAGFLSIEHRGAVHPCVAVADRDAKLKNAPLNVTATLLWDTALRRDFGITLLRAEGPRADALFGSVAVLFLHKEASAGVDSSSRARSGWHRP